MKSTNSIKFYGFLTLAVLATACGGSQFSTADDVVALAGSAGAPVAGEAGTQSGGDASTSSGSAGRSQSSSGSAGEGQAGVSGSPSAGSPSGGASSGGAPSAGASGALSAGAGGTQSVGGSAGSAGSGMDYQCSAPVSFMPAYDCMLKLCSDLGYQCGTVQNNCASGQYPCGAEAAMNCEVFLPTTSCPSYTACDSASHQCDQECSRDKTAVDGCNVGQTGAPVSTFRYDCQAGVVPGADPSGADDCTPDGSTPGAWCCSKNDLGCTVRYMPSCGADTPYLYSCLSNPNNSPDLARCNVHASGQYCCSAPDIE